MKKNFVIKKNELLLILTTLLFGQCLVGCADNPSVYVPPKDNPEEIISTKLASPPEGKIYHAAFPYFGDTEEVVTTNVMADFEQLATKKITWAYFSDNWLKGITFPKDNVETISKFGRVPFIRIMSRSNWDGGAVEPKYTMQRIIDGEYDVELNQWAVDAKNTKIPLLVEFGTEMNGNWFPWNAEFNGKDTKTDYGDPNIYDGMERFRDAYRHIIDICNKNKATNITWFYHINAEDSPAEEWNTKSGYYPGDNYIDWIGISVYGSQEPNGSYWPSFLKVMDDNWSGISSVSKTNKPIAILEWGVTESNTNGKKALWISNAFKTLLPGGKYNSKIKAISYWHSKYANLKLNSSSTSVTAYQDGVSDSTFISNPIFNEYKIGRSK